MRRRTVLGGVGLAGLSGVGAGACAIAPAFWKQFKAEMKRPIHPAPVIPDLSKWPDHGLYAAWLGHTTVLMKVSGWTILTDPVFSDRIGINLGLVTLGLKRLVKPAITPRRLPKIDLVLLSHAHMDHFDIPSLRALESRGTQVVTAVNTSDLLRAGRYGSVKELRWNERTRAGAIELRAIQVKHWGARMRTDTYRGYNGYVIESGRYRILFAGDTAFTPLFREARGAKPFDLVLMPVGAYNPWIYAHCTPEQAWQMANDAGAEFVLPVHHQTFQLSREPLLEPIERLYGAAGKDAHRVAADGIGQEFAIRA
jgi:L-ascorbate metabolism protein UlaG (beta-lactamase superfamily)